MRLAPFATEADVDEALRLFQVSTLDAAMSGSLAGSLMDKLFNYYKLNW
jgi:DNA replication licensing factor MCM5